MELDTSRIIADTNEYLKLTYDVSMKEANANELHSALAHVMMMQLSRQWSECKTARKGKRHAYYFSAEYLIGRLVYFNLFNLGILDELKSLFAIKGVDLACMEEVEDAALGNGGLGRLAACYLDSAATERIPLTGYGLRYRFGLFRQRIDENGNQRELADDWLKYGDPWSYRRDKHAVKIDFPDHTVLAVPYDVPIIGYQNGNIGTLRLWQCEAVEELDFDAFNAQDYERALAAKNKAEDITRVLYPNDSEWEGKRLRIKQQYVLSSASLHDIVRNFKEIYHTDDLTSFPEFIAIQLNDTHPAMSIPELIRILTDDKALSFMEAVKVVTGTCAYTNHTILAEALETWSVDQLTEVVPQLVPIIHRLDLIVKNKYHDPSVWIIDTERRVHMANLCVHFGFSVNGVAKIHTKILEESQLRGLYEIYPEKFSNKTNGISFRRWLYGCNSELSDWISAKIGNDYKLDPARLEDLKAFADDQEALAELEQIKSGAKARLSSFIKMREDVELLPDGVCDLHIKRIHEYKRQHLSALYVIHKYLEIKRGRVPDRPINFIFGGKAASAYVLAQDIIHLILVLSDIVNGDTDVNQYMRMVMVTDYNVTYAERLIPAADISEQISLASREASGTGNMKLMLNGALTLGTNDGANVELCEFAGEENIYLFGVSAEEVIGHYERGDYDPSAVYDKSETVREAVDFIISPQMTAAGRKENLERLYNEIRNRDRYMALLDLESYIEVKERMLRDYEDRMSWNRKVLMNIAGASYFSSDRAIAEYNRDIWKLKSFKTYSEEGK